MVWLRVDPRFDGIRDGPRRQDLIHWKLRPCDGQVRKSLAVDPVVKGEQTEAPAERMRPDEEVGENAARYTLALLSPAGGIGLEGLACQAPDGLIEVPVDGDTRVAQERVKKSFVAVWRSHQFGKHRRGQYQVSAPERRVERDPRGGV